MTESLYADCGVVRCPCCNMPFNGHPECHLPDCAIRKGTEEAIELRLADLLQPQSPDTCKLGHPRWALMEVSYIGLANGYACSICAAVEAESSLVVEECCEVVWGHNTGGFNRDAICEAIRTNFEKSKSDT